jgi:hypothetical protein
MITFIPSFSPSDCAEKVPIYSAVFGIIVTLNSSAISRISVCSSLSPLFHSRDIIFGFPLDFVLNIFPCWISIKAISISFIVLKVFGYFISQDLRINSSVQIPIDYFGSR